MKTNIESFLFRRLQNGEAAIKVITDREIIDITDFIKHQPLMRHDDNYEFGYYSKATENTAYQLLYSYSGDAKTANMYYKDLTRALSEIDHDYGGVITVQDLEEWYGISTKY